MYRSTPTYLIVHTLSHSLLKKPVHYNASKDMLVSKLRMQISKRLGCQRLHKRRKKNNISVKLEVFPEERKPWQMKTQTILWQILTVIIELESSVLVSAI